MTEKNLEIRNKFINKLFIKIEDLNNDFILLTNVDNKIFKNTINQKGGFEEIKKLEVAIYDKYGQFQDLIKHINESKQDDSNKILNYDNLFIVLQILQENINILIKKNFVETSKDGKQKKTKQITFNDAKKLLESLNEDTVSIGKSIKREDKDEAQKMHNAISLKSYPPEIYEFIKEKMNKTIIN